MTSDRLKDLLDGWKNQQLSAIEIDELLAAINQPDFEILLEQELIKDLEEGRYEGLEISGEKNRSLEKILNFVRRVSKKAEKTKIKRLAIWRRAAAATIFIIVTLGGGYWFFLQQKEQKQAVVSAYSEITAPKSNQAIIVLPDGKKISVDSLKQGMELKAYGLKVSKLANGELALINTTGAGAAQPVLVNVENPRASQPLQLKLPDNTHVWLNAQSSIQYPTAVTDTKFTVTALGEVYFEVAKNPSRKFIVQCGAFYTEVLGTKFNVKLYEGDEAQNVTLIEGSINVINNKDKSQRIKLRPNEQVEIKNNIIAAPKNVDVEDVLAWKNNLLSFNNANIKTIMLEIGRWYNVNVSFKGSISSRTFSGAISRNADLTEVLEILKKSSIKLELNNRTIVVMQ